MECADIRRHLSEYIDGECPEDIRGSVASHLESCPACREEYEQLRALSHRVRDLPRQELPFDFTAVMAERIAEEDLLRPRKKPVYKRTWARALELCACLLLVVGLVSIGGRFLHMGASSAPADFGASADSAYSEGYRTAEEPMETAEEAVETQSVSAAEDASAAADASVAAGAENAAAVQRKIVRNWSLGLKVEDYDGAYRQIEQIAADYGGYVVSGWSSGGADSSFRDGFISIRVEADRAEAAVDAIAALGELENNEFSSQDVTAEYYDTAARLTAYQAQEQRLLELYAQAGTVSETLEIEEQLTAVRAEIESLQGTINYYDQLTALSLIEISLYQPSSYTQTVEPRGWSGFVSRVRSSFLTGLNNTLDALAGLLTGLARILPFLLVLALICFAVIKLIRRRRRRK